MSVETLLTIQQVAGIVHAEHRTVRRAIRSGELEAALIGGKWLIRESAVEAWFESRRASGAEKSPQPRQRRSRAVLNAERRGSVARLQAIEERTG